MVIKKRERKNNNKAQSHQPKKQGVIASKYSNNPRNHQKIRIPLKLQAILQRINHRNPSKKIFRHFEKRYHIP